MCSSFASAGTDRAVPISQRNRAASCFPANVAEPSLRAPEALRGRILSLYMLALGVIYPIGAIIQGAVADRIGLRTVVVGTAALLLAVLVAFYIGRPHLTESLDDPRRGRSTLDAVASRVA